LYRPHLGKYGCKYQARPARKELRTNTKYFVVYQRQKENKQAIGAKERKKKRRKRKGKGKWKIELKNEERTHCLMCTSLSI
jgi:hypothetical protein